VKQKTSTRTNVAASNGLAGKVAAGVHGTDFWQAWHKAGGDTDMYVRENLPSYGLIGALLLTVTYDGMINTPDGLSAGAADIFVPLMALATLVCLFLVVFSGRCGVWEEVIG
jgi:hypothetical protein